MTEVAAIVSPTHWRVVSVTVTFQSDIAAVERLVDALRPQVDEMLIVDNGSAPAVRAGIEEIAARYAITVILLPGNLGIASAQNAGIRAASVRGCTHVLLTDDDSIPAPDMVGRLLDGGARATRAGHRVAAVGPVSDDTRGGSSTLLFAHRRWGPRRTSCAEQVDGLVDAAFVIASGCLIDRTAIEAVGGMREDLFIDHVDLEWCLRARAAGYSVFGVCDALLRHELGDRVMTLQWLRDRVVHLHSPVRNYYLVRNSLLLMRGPLLSWEWKVGYAIWVAKFAVFNIAFVAPRLARLKMIARGLWHGVAGRSGAYA